MAYTAHKDKESMKEHCDPPHILSAKIDKLAELVKNSKHFVIFTGAGVSTDAGIPDFRGPEGVWTLKAQGRTRTGRTTDSLSAVPTSTHMSIVELMNRGILKYMISQNCDGLHRRSGVKPERISELHGNGNIEYCEKCGFEYLRDFHCYRIKRGSKDHFTGRYCVLPKCGGRLMNSTIDFGQNLPVRPLQLAEEQSAMADLHMVLGSSLTVSPACNMPKKTAKKGGNLVIVNLQKTPLDNLATLRIFQRCDIVMKELMKRLNIEIPPFKLTRNFTIEHSLGSKGKWDIHVKGVDYGTDGSEIPASTLKAVQVLLPPEFDESSSLLLEKEPFRISKAMTRSSVILRLHMMGHYAEPPVDIVLKMSDDPKMVYCMQYNPATGEWTKKKSLEGDSMDSEDTESESMDTSTDEPFKVKLTQMKVRGTNIPGNWSAAALIVDTDRQPMLATFGGSGDNREFAPINCLDLQTLKWKPRMGGDAADTPYTNKRRWGHTATVMHDVDSCKVYLIGGWDSSSQYNDVFMFDCRSNSVKPVTTRGTAPNYRAGHTATGVGRNIVVFGGAICNGGAYSFYNDVFLFNVDKAKWKKLACKGDVPSPRAQHSTTFVAGHLVVIGGFTGTAVTNDVYTLNLDNLTWTKINTKGTPPTAQDNISTSDFRVHPARHTAVPLTRSKKQDEREKEEEARQDDSLQLVYLGPSGVHLLDVTNWTWTTPEVENEHDVPTTMACHVACDISASEMLWLGGTAKDSKGSVYSLSLM